MRRLVYIALLLIAGVSSSILAHETNGESCTEFTGRQRENASIRLFHTNQIEAIFQRDAVETIEDAELFISDIQEWVTLSDSLMFHEEAAEVHCEEYGDTVQTYEDLLGSMGRLSAIVQTNLRAVLEGDTDNARLVDMQNSLKDRIDLLAAEYLRQYELYFSRD